MIMIIRNLISANYMFYKTRIAMNCPRIFHELFILIICIDRIHVFVEYVIAINEFLWLSLLGIPSEWYRAFHLTEYGGCACLQEYIKDINNLSLFVLNN